MGVDADSAPLAVAGIGDPSGDVFGNGLLRSRHVRLRAAFNHLHVFLDPDPDPARSYAERERLFRSGLGWDAYDPGLLSPGGAVVSRAAKRVVLSAEVQAMLGLRENAVSGEQLVRAVLALEGDLLFNGGIGTYVAASDETDADVRDPVNDGVRVRAPALRVRVVAEGGNLGATQRGRIEYALAGGRIDTDAIDNSAGVDMSDHEVNLKVCLQPAVAAGELSPEARNALLVAVTEDVTERVLAHNRSQSRLLGLDQVRSRTRMADFRELIAELERTTGLDRVGEALPDRDALRARRGTFLGFTRPELAVLMAHTKIQLQREIVASRLPADPLFEAHLLAYFPPAVVERHRPLVDAHPLRAAIVATEVANALVDGVGTTFLYRVMRDTGARPVDAVWAWAVAWTLVDGGRVAPELETGSHGQEAEYNARLVLERTVERATKWLLVNADASRPAAQVVADLAAPSREARERLTAWLGGAEAEAFQKLLSELEIAGLPSGVARELASADWIVGALDVVRVAREAGVGLEAAGQTYALLAQHVDFAWLWARLVEVGEEDRWHRRAVEGLIADLLDARRRLTRVALVRVEAVPELRLAVVNDLIRDLRAAPRVTLAALQVVVREIRRLAEEA
jgi:glutamate dehydrogenase